MTEAGLYRLAIRLSRALLAEGAVLAFGHDWRDDGIMDAVCGSAIDSFGTPGINVYPPLILNFIPWPDSPRTADDALLRLEGILAVEEAGLPQDVAEMSARAALEPDLLCYLRSRSLTHLRRQLTGLCSARISIGGREHGYSGRYPGVFEEILFALEEDQPTYLAGLLGGITETLGQAIQRRVAMPSGFSGTALSASANGASSIADLYAVWGKHAQRSEHPEDQRIDPLAAWETACRLGAERLDHNGLSEGENLRLLETTVEEEAILLVLKGLRNVRERSG